jgi:matrix metalloproteinase-17 (membrane-inserted)
VTNDVVSVEQNDDGDDPVVGRHYWIFDDNRIATEGDGSTYPRNLSSLGLPHHVDHVDAAFFWSFNRQAYLVSANLYWALDERWNRVNTDDYPRDMIMWQGIDIPLDDAFVDLTGRCSRRTMSVRDSCRSRLGSTYFLKGLDFWRLNDTSMESAVDYPRSINSQWLFCDRPRPLSSTSATLRPSRSSLLVLCSLVLSVCSSL